jgi:hypothetical protein
MLTETVTDYSKKTNGNHNNADWAKLGETVVKAVNAEYVAIRLTYKNYHHGLGLLCFTCYLTDVCAQMRNVVQMMKEFLNEFWNNIAGHQ